MRTFISVLGLLFSMAAGSIAAADQSAFYPLASDYQATVQLFDRIADNTRGLNRNDRRMIDRFDKEVRKLRTAARNPRHRNRMLNQWREVQRLQAQIQSKVLNRYTPNHDLDMSWNEVVLRYRLIDDEFLYYVENPRHFNSVQRIPRSNALRDRYYRSTQPLPSSAQ